jgi:hypothetical protein
MTENYDQKKIRQLRIRETLLPPELKEIPLCYVEDVAGISPQAKLILVDALAKGPINIARALEYFQNTFVLTTDDLLEVARPRKRGSRQIESDQDQQQEDAIVPCNSQSADPFPATQLSAALDPRDIKTLTEILINCYPSMPITSAEGLAKSEVMRESIRVVAAVRQALESDHSKSDFVILALFGLFRTTKIRFQEIVQSNSTYLKAIKQSGIALD